MRYFCAKIWQQYTQVLAWLIWIIVLTTSTGDRCLVLVLKHLGQFLSSTGLEVRLVLVRSPLCPSFWSSSAFKSLYAVCCCSMLLHYSNSERLDTVVYNSAVAGTPLLVTDTSTTALPFAGTKSRYVKPPPIISPASL